MHPLSLSSRSCFLLSRLPPLGRLPRLPFQASLGSQGLDSLISFLHAPSPGGCCPQEPVDSPARSWVWGPPTQETLPTTEEPLVSLHFSLCTATPGILLSAGDGGWGILSTHSPQGSQCTPGCPHPPFCSLSADVHLTKIQSPVRHPRGFDGVTGRLEGATSSGGKRRGDPTLISVGKVFRRATGSPAGDMFVQYKRSQ